MKAVDHSPSTMTKLRCPCLNVCIHVKENAERQTEGNSFVSESCEGNFFSNNLCEIELGVGGITKVTHIICNFQIHDYTYSYSSILILQWV